MTFSIIYLVIGFIISNLMCRNIGYKHGGYAPWRDYIKMDDAWAVIVPLAIMWFPVVVYSTAFNLIKKYVIEAQ